MFKTFLPISTLLLTSAIVFLVAPGVSGGSTAQDPAPATLTGPPAPAEKNPVKATSDSQAKAKRTYGFDCALCHGSNGDGKTDLARDMQLKLSDLSDGKTLAGKSDSELFRAIRNGLDKMPPETADRAKDDDIWNLVIYVRGLAKNAPAATASNP